ncbi:HNH endonuclease [Aldersonia sp. NBC_00410]|uniref:HNH endonuclease n=1 Tax=Aldersonia sp. NBC_00410 TaxID=2975954 RepID=UPI00225713A4|nr:HNH endonuclease [Aldersonia sp. NBC_00410]MCX5044647.1 HNH endonuclease [Aldersonia sp. NBC_00410]
MSSFLAEPGALTSWRQVVLMGVNTRTYKFALGSALLDLAREGHDGVPLRDLAAAYAQALVTRPGEFPQAPAAQTLSDGDFLSVLRRERAESLAEGRPSDELVDAAVKSMPGMVMQKFHNLRAIGEVPHTFYEIVGRGNARMVRFTSELVKVAAVDTLLVSELDARWSIVETSFDAGIGRSLIGGVDVSVDSETLLVRRVAVTGVRQAIDGFQGGRCFYCGAPFEDLGVDVHVDHVFPFSWMNTGSWRGPDLNHIWNLVLACAPCNMTKSNRPPSALEIKRLLERNDAIDLSPHPLRRTIEITMGTIGPTAADRARQRREFVAAVWLLTTDGPSGLSSRV